MLKARNKEALEIIEKCRSLGLVMSEVSGGVLVHIPLFQDFIKKLNPAIDESLRVREFRSVMKFFEKITHQKGGHGRWRLWETGSFCIHGKDTKKGFVVRKDSLPVGDKW